MSIPLPLLSAKPAPKGLVGRIGKVCFAALLLASVTTPSASAADSAAQWEPCGWSGGGFYFGAAYHPTKKGVMYMGTNVAGMYKSEDNGRNWRAINKGLAHYIVHSLTVTAVSPETVYASTVGGLCKSIDGGENWQLLPHTGPDELRITGERDLSIHPIAVDPKDANIVYAGSPSGKVFKSTDGGQAWEAVYEKKFAEEAPGVLRVQFGKASAAPFGGIWLPLPFPAGAKSADCVGVGFSMQANKIQPGKSFVTLKTTGEASYISKDLAELFKGEQLQDVVLSAQDFTLDPTFAKKNPEKAQALSVVDWSKVNRMDFSCVGSMEKGPVARFSKFYFAMTRTPDGKTAPATKPILFTVRDFTTDRKVGTYGSVNVGNETGGSVYSVAVAQKEPSMVLAATHSAGLVQSLDAGKTWVELNTPKKASSIAIDPANPNLVYASFFTDGIWKSTDKGKTWTSVTEGLVKDFAVRQVIISPENPQDVYAIGTVGWSGGFSMSNNGGKTWTTVRTLTADVEADPTSQDIIKEGDPTARMSVPTNLAINPFNLNQLFMSANWRPSMSEDGGRTWKECDNGADISVVTDIRFSGDRTYVSAMDEGAFVSEDNGKKWRQLWPTKPAPNFGGHTWRLAVDKIKGEDRVIGGHSPWNMRFPSCAVVSGDGGNTYKDSSAGLPDYTITQNTMWGRGYPRALAVDPNNSNVVYMGIDGDPTEGKTGGGIFKSEDGGYTWNQLRNQPGSRRMFYGLAVDPTDSKRLFWGTCGTNGGLYRSEDGGTSWTQVFSKESWIFNVLVTKAGVVYCPGKNLYRSTDHGNTWTQLTKFNNKRAVCGIEVDPRDPKTMWISCVTWGSYADGAVYKTTDDGATWQDITGDLPYVCPLVLRFNPATNELWAGSSPMYKIKQ